MFVLERVMKYQQRIRSTCSSSIYRCRCAFYLVCSSSTNQNVWMFKNRKLEFERERNVLYTVIWSRFFCLDCTYSYSFPGVVPDKEA